MHSLWFFFLRKREFSVLLMVTLIAIGVYSVNAIPKESSPEVIVPIAIVSTAYQGASARDIEELITNTLEGEIGTVDDLDTITSTSRDGVSIITASFDAKADIETSIQNVKDAVDAVQGELPSEATTPMVSEVNFANQPILVVSVSAELPPRAFTELAESVADELEGVRGVSDVVIGGVRTHEVQVVVREAALRSFGLSLSMVTNALREANLTLPVGTVVTGGIEYAVRYEGKIQDIDAIQDVPVGTSGGLPVYVRDIATVTNGVERESSISRVSVEGVPSASAFTLSIFKRAGEDVTQMSAAVHEALLEMQRDGNILGESQVLVVFDQGENVKKDLSELIKAGAETVALVIITLLLTIGWRESLVAALSIPLSFVIAFIGLYASGNTINFISLFALILAIGILVDSGIVITEAIHTRMRKLKDADAAAHAAIKEYAWPLIGGTMTTVAVFAPLFFLSGVTGEFIASIPFTIIFVLLASIVVALGMVPLIAIYLTNHSSANRFEELQEEYTHRAQAWYRAQLIRVLKHARAQKLFFGALAIGFVCVFILPLSGALKVVFFPPEDVDFAFVEIETVQGTPLRDTDMVVRTVEELLYEKSYIESFTSEAGLGSSFTGGGQSGAKYGNITLTLRADRTMSSREIADDLRTTFLPIKNADIKISEIQNGPPTGAPVVIKFFGDDLTALGQAVESAESVLSRIEGVRDVELSTNSSATELVLNVDADKARAAGVSPLQVGETLRSAVFGVVATTFTRNGDDVDVVVKLEVDNTGEDASAAPRITLDALRNLSIPTPGGESVLIGALIEESLSPAQAVIVHEDEERVESVSAYTEGSVTAAEVVAEFKNAVTDVSFPEGVRVVYGGETEDINRSFTEMALAFVAGLLLMLAILVLSFNSIRYALYLLLAVPLSLIGVFAGLAATGQALVRV